MALKFPPLISIVTDGVMDEVKQWQSRSLDAVSPVVYFDCIHVKVRDAGSIRAKAIYLTIGINMEGHKEILGYELPRLRVPSSGSVLSLNSKTVACRISLSLVSTA